MVQAKGKSLLIGNICISISTLLFIGWCVINTRDRIDLSKWNPDLMTMDESYRKFEGKPGNWSGDAHLVSKFHES
jgi:hypothetical protein